MPETYFGRLSFIREKAPELLKYPYVVKSTSGKKARDTWKIENSEDFEAIFDELRQREKQGIRFFAQKLIRASQRVRVLIIGGKAVGAITRPTKWRKSFIKMQNGEFPEGKKEALIPIPDKYSEIALKATQAADLDISGVDILEEDETGKLYVIEANAAPSWKLIARDCEVNVESEILEYLVKV
jgi:glutathione synthase/RimK-type ligase-like ATP-grasp enzyme